MRAGQLGGINRLPGNDAPNKSTQTPPFVPFPTIIPAGTAVYTLGLKTWVNTLVHHANAAPTSMHCTDLQKLRSMQIQGLEGLLPILGELVPRQPYQDCVQRPLSSHLGWYHAGGGARRNRWLSSLHATSVACGKVVHRGRSVCVCVTVGGPRALGAQGKGRFFRRRETREADARPKRLSGRWDVRGTDQVVWRRRWDGDSLTCGNLRVQLGVVRLMLTWWRRWDSGAAATVV
jgi:hypothetical protein